MLLIESHIRLVQIRKMGAACLFLFLIFSEGLSAQEDSDTLPGELISYVQTRARIDAGYEQAIHWKTQEDEHDYWADQRTFENLIKKRSYTAYKGYLAAKHVAYYKHQEDCNRKCDHGAYYLQQANFYNRYGAREYLGNTATTLISTQDHSNLPTPDTRIAY